MNLRERIRMRIAKHENWFAFLWYLHLVKNEDPRRKEDRGDTEGELQCLHGLGVANHARCAVSR